MSISTIVLAITGHFGAGASPPLPPPPGPGAKEWVKQKLLDLGRLLAKLAERAAYALPGIIGSVVSWLLSFLGKSAVWLAQNIWALVVALGGLLLLAAQELITSR